jgi:Lrp/AsnC family leucine-responsive transcriptional regulator
MAGRSGIDDVDRRLLELLLVDGRRSINELAAAVNVSRASAYQRLDRLKAEGVLKGFTAVVDEAKLGLPIIVLILINADQRRWREVRDDLLLLPGLEQLGLTTGAFDFVATVRLAAVEELRDVVLEWLHGIEGIHDTQTVFMLEQHHRRPAFPAKEAARKPRARVQVP